MVIFIKLGIEKEKGGGKEAILKEKSKQTKKKKQTNIITSPIPKEGNFPLRSIL